MTIYDYVWLCMAMYDYVWIYMTMFDYVCLCMAIFDSVWLCMTVFDYVWLCVSMYEYIMTLHDSLQFCKNMTKYDYVWLCMTMYDSVWLCHMSEIVKLAQLWTNFVILSWTCVGWFRMVQNWSNYSKRLKKTSLFSNYAKEILTLFNLTHLCTNFVLVYLMNNKPLFRNLLK